MMAFFHYCLEKLEGPYGQHFLLTILSLQEWYRKFRAKCRGKYTAILLIFFLILGLRLIQFLDLALSRGVTLKYFFAGSCGLISLMFAPIYPFIGIIVYCVFVYLAPMGGFGLSVIVTIATFLGWLIWAIMNKKYRLVKAKQNYLILGLWLTMLISVIFAFNKSYCWEPLEDISKTFFFYLATINLIDSKRKVKYFIWTLLFIFGFLSLDVDVLYFFSGITHLGGAGGGDNNLFALSLVMTIPLAFYFLFVEKSPLLKGILILLFSSMILATILTFSRGGFLGLVAILGLLWLKNRYKLLSFFTVLLLTTFPFFFLPEGYKDRISTILEYRQDGSAMGRIEAWKAGWEMIKNRPLVGVGLGNFSSLSQQYNLQAPRGIEPHNSFIQIASECGLIALLFFISLPLVSIWELRQLRKKFATDMKKKKWIVPMANMLEISFCGYFVSGSFLHQATLPLFYLFIGLSGAVKHIAEKDWGE